VGDANEGLPPYTTPGSARQIARYNLPGPPCRAPAWYPAHIVFNIPELVSEIVHWQVQGLGDFAYEKSRDIGGKKEFVESELEPSLVIAREREKKSKDEGELHRILYSFIIPIHHVVIHSKEYKIR
jgi:hypothetical protein